MKIFGKRIQEQPKMYGSFSKELKSVLYEGGYVASIGMHGVIKLILLLQQEYKSIHFVKCSLWSSKGVSSIFIKVKNGLTLLLKNSD